MVHVPILRAGRPYASLDQVDLLDVKTAEPVARVSMANPGLIARDLRDEGRGQAALARLTTAELLDLCKRAAELFAGGALPADPDSGDEHTPEDYVRLLSATTGMPRALCHKNMEKIRFVLAEMPQVLSGLTRGLDAAVLDSGWSRSGGSAVSYLLEADRLGVILPSNSPGVHSLWLTSIPLKVPLALKPGRQEPWTPMRIAQALMRAGCPGEALGFYPTSRAGATEIMLRCQRSMFFGDASSVRGWKDDPRVEIHGPGWSKVILGPDLAEGWEDHLELLASSVAENGGRSCLNASGVWTCAQGRPLAEALAASLAQIEARALDDPRASLAAFSDPRVAERISEFVDAKLRIPGAEDLSATARGGGRLVEHDGCTFLLPTVIWCADPNHPLASTELLFPFVSVVQVAPAELPQRIGSTLVATVLSADAGFRRAMMKARNVDRLNLGPIPTWRVSWDQPHEGNLFEHLYRRRAFQSDVA